MVDLILIYGGAFNPPTIAHQAILQELIKYGSKKAESCSIILMPSGDRVDKTIGSTSSLKLKYTKALLDSVKTYENTKIIIDNYESSSKKETSTINTNKYINNHYKTGKKVWVFGSDSINTMRQWPGGVELWNGLHILVVGRPGHPAIDMPPNSSTLKFKMPKISSTEVRNRIALNQSVEDLVPVEVWKILNTS
jgi:nicotinate-nucleotide adenylyltransferase